MAVNCRTRLCWNRPFTRDQVAAGTWCASSMNRCVHSSARRWRAGSGHFAIRFGDTGTFPTQSLRRVPKERLSLQGGRCCGSWASPTRDRLHPQRSSEIGVNTYYAAPSFWSRCLSLLQPDTASSITACTLPIAPVYP